VYSHVITGCTLIYSNWNFWYIKRSINVCWRGYWTTSNGTNRRHSWLVAALQWIIWDL